jgi:2-polyprenyl-3-methyl-5-hydroxy-6-metoxy-1,4-benzoquinol methylase
MSTAHAQEVAAGQRFEFGKNWARFLEDLRDDQIQLAEQSLKTMLGLPSLAGKTFVDIGSGSGLFSLAARRMGASVCSLDFDPHSVACGRELRRRYFNGDETNWKIVEGSALDPAFLKSLGKFDIVYSWGVLHHTGSMWEALGNVAQMVKENGLLFVSIYNDQGTPSRRWHAIKKAYNATAPGLRWTMLVPCFIHLWWVPILAPFKEYRKFRGMSLWRDLVDWVGGYPFEVAKPEEMFHFYRDRGFQLIEMTTNGGSLGCNEFVFRKAGN